MTDDTVQFNNTPPGPCTLDVAINTLQQLSITNWLDTLTLNNGVTIEGARGSFVLSDASTIVLNNDSGLTLFNAQGGSAWSAGSIIAGTTGDPPQTSNSTFYVSGCSLGISGAPAALGVNMLLQNTRVNGPTGLVTLDNMTANLPLTGVSNKIECGNGGTLWLKQDISAAGQMDARGGISLGGAHTGSLAVQVDTGGILQRLGAGGVSPNSVSVAGAVYNQGGKVDVGTGRLNITGEDADDNSYWQDTGANALLNVRSDGTIKGAGNFLIDVGTVQVTPPSSGNGPAIDSAELIFGNDSNTYLTVVDSGGTQGTVTIKGPVTLAANTTTTLSFSGANDTSDLLDVQGTLTLAGTLSLNGDEKPDDTLYFLDSSGAGATINGDFAQITNNVGGTASGDKVQINGQLWYYEVDIN
jgi:hypothetical protein